MRRVQFIAGGEQAKDFKKEGVKYIPNNGLYTLIVYSSKHAHSPYFFITDLGMMDENMVTFIMEFIEDFEDHDKGRRKIFEEVLLPIWKAKRSRIESRNTQFNEIIFHIQTPKKYSAKVVIQLSSVLTVEEDDAIDGLLLFKE